MVLQNKGKWILPFSSLLYRHLPSRSPIVWMTPLAFTIRQYSGKSKVICDPADSEDLLSEELTQTILNRLPAIISGMRGILPAT